MKVLTYLFFGAVLAFCLSFAGIVNAGPMGRAIMINRDHQAANQKIVSPQTPERWGHLNRFSRDNLEKNGLSGGIMLPSYDRQHLPKNYRNQY